jgi:hypothetical protein
LVHTDSTKGKARVWLRTRAPVNIDSQPPSSLASAAALSKTDAFPCRLPSLPTAGTTTGTTSSPGRAAVVNGRTQGSWFVALLSALLALGCGEDGSSSGGADAGEGADTADEGSSDTGDEGSDVGAGEEGNDATAEDAGGDTGSDTGPEPCPGVPCTEGARCEDGQVVTCAADEDGCFVEVATPCPLDTVCGELNGEIQCVSAGFECEGEGCNEPGATECSGTVIRVCLTVGNCTEWQVQSDCADDSLVCSADGGTAECVAERVCEDDPSCFALGKFCDGNTLTTCAEGPDGCLEVTAALDCAASGGACLDGAPAKCGGEVVGGWVFELLADYDSEMPSGLGPLTQLDNYPHLDDGQVFFRGASSPAIVPPQATQSDAIYRWSPEGGLESMVQVGTPIPEGVGSFLTFDAMVVNSPSASGGKMAFVGNGPAEQRGIYVRTPEGIQRVADRTTEIPAGTGTFAGLGEPYLNGNDLIFIGNDFGQQGGIYWDSSGALRKVVNLEDGPPNGDGAYTGLGPTDLQNGELAFLGYSKALPGTVADGGQSGLYRILLADTVLGSPDPVVVVDETDSIPGINDTFFILTGALIDGAQTVFHGRGTPGPLGPFGTQIYKGIFRTDGQTITTVVDTDDTMPESVETFSYDFANGLTSQYVAIHEGAVLLRGVGTTGNQQTQIGVYLAPAGEGPLEKVLDLGDVLQGKAIKDILFGKYGFDGKNIAMMVEFSDKEQSIYLATRIE